MKNLILLLVFPLVIFCQNEIEEVDITEEEEEEEILPFAVVETAPIFPGCENLDLIEREEIELEIFEYIYTEIKNLHTYVLQEKNKKIIHKIKERRTLTKKENKFSEKLKEDYINRIIKKVNSLEGLVAFDQLLYLKQELSIDVIFTWVDKSNNRFSAFEFNIEATIKRIKKNITDYNNMEASELLMKKKKLITRCFNEGIMRHVSKRFQYPKIAKEYGIQGKVFVSFVVDKTGNITNVQVVRGVDKNLDKEAIRLITSLPKMQPAFQKGKPVSINYTIPINFLLQ